MCKRECVRERGRGRVCERERGTGSRCTHTYSFDMQL